MVIIIDEVIKTKDRNIMKFFIPALGEGPAKSYFFEEFYKLKK
jgi:hypothetical protein